jgi:hypothetical protein
MLNSGKEFRDKKENILTLVLSEECFELDVLGECG